MEYYNGVTIFYSMGNLCYGGNMDPSDKDSVIVRADFTFDRASGIVVLDDLRVIPRCVSSSTECNDYRPTPYAEGSEGYDRVLSRLRWSE